MPKHGSLKSAGKQQESATFLQHSFFSVALQFLLAAAQLSVKMTSAVQKKPVFTVQLLQRSIPKIAAQLPFSLVACCRGGV